MVFAPSPDNRPNNQGRTPLEKRSRKRKELPRSTEFANSLEHTMHAFQQAEDSLVEDMQRILMETKKQYDDVHAEAERKEQTLREIREAIRLAEMQSGVDAAAPAAAPGAPGGSAPGGSGNAIVGGTGANGNNGNSTIVRRTGGRAEDQRQDFLQQYEEAVARIGECQMNRKVYTHILERSRREMAVLKQKVTKMETHLQRKIQEEQAKLAACRKISQAREQQVVELERMTADLEHERKLREKALNSITFSLQTKRNAVKRRTDFEKWRHEIALEAANEAFNASAARLRKMWAIEKLAGNCLQKIMYEQVERSQATEDGFQRIREVTGLTDVMDIVHKFLNRDAEHEQLKNASREAEARLEAIKEEYDQFKRYTEGRIFDPASHGSTSRAIYQEVERHEAELSKILKEHEAARLQLQQTNVQHEHLKRWSRRMAKSLSFFDTYFLFDEDNLVDFFDRMNSHTIPQLIQEVRNQFSGGRLHRQNFAAAAAKEHHEQARLLNDRDFLRANCRVLAGNPDRDNFPGGGLDSPSKGQGAGGKSNQNNAQQKGSPGGQNQGGGGGGSGPGGGGGGNLNNNSSDHANLEFDEEADREALKAASLARAADGERKKELANKRRVQK